MARKATKPPAGVIRMKVSLIDDPGCWREIEVAASASLWKLAEAIVGAFGFDFDHAFGFYSDLDEFYQDSKTRYEMFADMDDADDWPPEPGQSPAGSVKKTKVGQAFAKIGQRMQFIFDYGDEWRFAIEVTGFGTRVAGQRYPAVVASLGTAPEQYPDEEDE
jgi:hypothetical protein